MERSPGKNSTTCLSVVIPCFDERNTLLECLERALSIREPELLLEITIVDECSTDRSYEVALELAERNIPINLFLSLGHFTQAKSDVVDRPARYSRPFLGPALNLFQNASLDSGRQRGIKEASHG